MSDPQGAAPELLPGWLTSSDRPTREIPNALWRLHHAADYMRADGQAATADVDLTTIVDALEEYASLVGARERVAELETGLANAHPVIKNLRAERDDAGHRAARLEKHAAEAEKCRQAAEEMVFTERARADRAETERDGFQQGCIDRGTIIGELRASLTKAEGERRACALVMNQAEVDRDRAHLTVRAMSKSIVEHKMRADVAEADVERLLREASDE